MGGNSPGCRCSGHDVVLTLNTSQMVDFESFDHHTSLGWLRATLIGHVHLGWHVPFPRIGQTGEAHQLIAPINSRPINMRRISDVPAPISISLASRNMRLTGLSVRNPAPPMACTAWWA